MAVATEHCSADVKSKETGLQQRYKSISSLASQIDNYIKNSPLNEGLFQPNPILLRKRLKEKCSKALLSNEFSFLQMDKIEDMLWNQGFYRVIQKCRNSQGIQGDTPLQNAYRTHLTAGIGFYTSLLARMADRYHLESAHLDWNRQVQTTAINSTKNPFELYMYKVLIHLGDLSRYQQVFTRSLELTKRFYYQAIMLNPSLGHAFNQLGGMYSGLNYNLDSVYFYLRSLACTEPMKYLSEVNLKTIYSKNRAELDHINAIPIAPDASESEHNERSIRRFLAGFIRLQEIILISKIPDQNSGADMEYMCSRVLKDFEEFLRIDSMVGSSPNSFRNEHFLVSIVGGDPLFKICMISILASQILRTDGSTHTAYATSFALSIFSLVLQNCYARARNIIICQLDESVVAKLPDFHSLKLNALQILSQDFANKQSLIVGDNEVVNNIDFIQKTSPTEQLTNVDGDANTKVESNITQTDEDSPPKYEIPKKAVNINSKSDPEVEVTNEKQVASACTSLKKVKLVNGNLSEGNVSDSIQSSRSNSSSSSGFEILGTDYSSEDEDNTQTDKSREEKCEKPQDSEKLETPDPSPVDKLEESANPTLNSETSGSIKYVELTPKSQESYDQSFFVQTSTPFNPQSKDNPFDQESVLSTPHSFGDEFPPPVTENLYRYKPKISLAAKFTLEEDDTPPAIADTETPVHISDALSKLCRSLQNESGLWVTRAFSIWLTNHPAVLAACAHKNAMLWSHLATLLNFLPSCQDFVQHGVFPQHEPEFSVTEDWSQPHPLYEDKLLYGLMTDDDVGALPTIFTSATSEEEQSLTRLICLHRFGLLMAANKMTPAFAYDKTTHLFIGPAQKEVLDAKIAEETRLIEQMQSRERQGTLMKALAHQRLRGQVDMLKCQQQNLRESVLPFVLIPDALSLCNQLNTLKKLIQSNRFIVVIANVTLRILDEMKGQKQNYHARQALRFIEHEFESNPQYVRPQIHSAPAAHTGGRGRRRQPYNPTISSIKELFEVGVKHSKLEESVSRDAICLLFDVGIIQNFLSPERRTYNQIAQVVETAEQVGVTWKSVPDLFYKWMSQKTE